MNHLDTLIALARRKERLILRSDAQRAAIAGDFRQFEKPAVHIDRAIAAVRYLKAHPLLAALLGAAAVVIGRRNLATWAGRGWVVWRAWRSFGAWTGRNAL